MAIALVKLTYRHVIDASSTEEFERQIFQASYREFLFKSREYSQRGELQTFSAMRANDHGANALHYQISCAVSHFLDPLNYKISSLVDEAGRKISYDAAVFELMESDLSDVYKHKLTIRFITVTYLLHQVLGNYMVLSPERLTDGNDEFAGTISLQLANGLAISSYKEIKPQESMYELRTVFNSN